MVAFAAVGAMLWASPPAWGRDHNAIGIDAQGRTVVAGVAGNDFGVARLNPDGSLDRSFGPAGKVTTHFGRQGEDAANALAIDPEGRIVVVGETCCSPGTHDFAIARYLPDGTLDPTFGNGGKVTTSFGDITAAHAVAIDGRGRIIVAGIASDDEIAVARYEPNGALDSTFGSGGKVITSPPRGRTAVGGVALEPGGAIVVAGTLGYTQILLAGYTSSGAPDPSFGTNGLVIATFGSPYASLISLATDATGRLVVAGSAQGGIRVFPDSDFAVARFNPDGSRDNAFGNKGQVTTDFNPGNDGYASDDTATAVAVEPSGDIVAAGYANNCPTNPCNGGFTNHLALARYLPDGSLDPAFGDGGKVTRDLASQSTLPTALAIDPAGRVTVSGNYADLFTVFRFAADGSVDPSFGSGGTASLNFHARTWITSANINSTRRKATFVVNASGYWAELQCRLLAAHKTPRFSECTPDPVPFEGEKEAYTGLRRGRYKFQVRAVRGHGSDSPPAQWKFRIG